MEAIWEIERDIERFIVKKDLPQLDYKVRGRREHNNNKLYLIIEENWIRVTFQRLKDFFYNDLYNW